ncbi:outer envelope pore protein 16-2, chloroplastic [Dorcoceras hygrometricum]|uniref:Outer envelope pore protein 16-2, chloroplastic n=1 Tax=Dorcoceras hygrometricum TaxID=472368 RepID=A0A2Z7C158_9LAMI|nr:outer envelope pore protein 16-2, chloroplastic [Dorcoceras hygrometricum]
MSTSGNNLETRSLLDDFRSFDKGGFFDLGHPLLNRIAESFVKAAGIGAIQAVSREAYLTAVESVNGDSTTGSNTDVKNQRFPDLRGESNRKSVEALVKNTSTEALQWGLAAGIYSGVTYGLKEARGVHDWRNSLIAGAATGAVLALTTGDHSHEQVVQSAITGAAISTVANLLKGIF